MDEKELVELIAKQLVDQPEGVSVTPVEKDGETVLELRVAQGEAGRVIGRQGSIAKSLRTIVNAVSVRNGRRVSVEIMD
jgi:hypothetical protein